MKAIHNSLNKLSIKIGTVFNISKIQNESNSQLLPQSLQWVPNCV